MSEDLIEGHTSFDKTIPSFMKSYGNEKMTLPAKYNYESWTSQYGTKFTGPTQTEARRFPNRAG